MKSKDDKINDTIKGMLSDALYELLLEKDLEDISVAAILKQSGLSRSTFYRHFSDKYELAIWKYKKLLDSLVTEFVSPDALQKTSRVTLRYIYEHRIQFRKILHYTGQNSFNEYFINETIAIAKRAQKMKGLRLSQKDYYSIDYHSMGFLSVLNQWLQSDDPPTPEEISEIIYENRNERINMLVSGVAD